MSNPFQSALQSVLNSQLDPRQAALSIYLLLTPPERLALLDADLTASEVFAQFKQEPYNARPYHAGTIERVGLPGIRFSDGPRGASVGKSTAFPAPITRAASWDVKLEKEIGNAIGHEIRTQGANFFGGVCINLARSPHWGRAQESYGEDPLILGTFGSSLSRGIRRYAMPCVKHFALNSMEDMRFNVDVRVEEDVFHECYLPHFKQVLDEGGAESIMSCYNTINGIQGGQNPDTLNGIVREEWGREDIFIMSDFIWGLRSGPESVKAGLDIEMMFRSVRMRSLPKALEEGTISEDDVKRLGVRLIAAQLRYYARMEKETGPARGMEVVGCKEHLELARRASSSGMVLLKNDSPEGQGEEAILPLSKSDTKRIAVIGEIAKAKQTGDAGSSAVHTPEIVTPWEGLSAYAESHNIEITYHDGIDLNSATELAKTCDAVILVVGMTGKEEGESLFNTDPQINSLVFPGWFGSWAFTRFVQLLGRWLNTVGGDRDNLQLRPKDLNLAERLSPIVGEKTVLVVSAGSTICLPPSVVDQTSSILYTGYGGCQFGHALTDVIFGSAEPSGRLPYVIPENELEDLPVWDRWAKKIVYDRWWGYRKIRKDGKKPAFPFGWGLGYGSWEVVKGSLVVPEKMEGRFFDVEVKIRNPGTVSTSPVIQVYGGKSSTSLEENDYTNVLLGFHKEQSLAPGQESTIKIQCRLNPVAHYLPKWLADKGQRWKVDEGTYVIRVGKFEGDEEASTKEMKAEKEIRW